MGEYKRLTARNPENNMAYLVHVKPSEQEVDSKYPNTLRCILDGIQRLGDYEDSGLSLEQAKNAKSALSLAKEALEEVKPFDWAPTYNDPDSGGDPCYFCSEHGGAHRPECKLLLALVAIDKAIGGEQT